MRYVRNAWYVAGWSTELVDEKPFAITILNEPIVIYRSASGRLVALEDRCVHRLAALSLGRCEGENLRCMYHGLLFDPDGRTIEIPGQDTVPAIAKVKSYPVVDKHSWLWIWMGDPALADQNLIPPAVGLDDPNYVLGHGQLDYNAAAFLISDNLLDFSHLTFVHAASFDATDSWANSRPNITQLERGVRIERWFTSEPPMRTNPDQSLIDRWQTYDFMVPGVLLMTGGSYTPGTAEQLGFATPDLLKAKGSVTFTSQAVTPLTDKTSRYFFSWGPRVDLGGEKMRDILMGVAGKAFEEDRIMIEAQQAVYELTPMPKVMPTNSDKALVIYNRLVEKLVRKDSTDVQAAA